MILSSFLNALLQEKISIIFKEKNYYKKKTNIHKFKFIISQDKKFLYFFYENSYGLDYADALTLSLQEDSTIQDFKNLVEDKVRQIILSLNFSESSSTYSMIHFGI